jgi:hypothetical protein
MKKIDQNKAMILEQLRKTPIVESACQKVGVSRMTFYRYKKEDPDFEKKVEVAISEGRLLVNDFAELQLISAVKDRNLTAILYWLKSHHPSYRTRIEIEGQLEVIKEFSPEQKELIQKAMTLGKIMLEKK